MEIVLKKKLVATKKFRLHELISEPLASTNIAVTVGCLSYCMEHPKLGLD
ncbi:hypothetical protein Gorai_003090, partial [Gossypium raimondii]|nr:hypothetical protein [Gossypium raimondii]